MLPITQAESLGQGLARDGVEQWSQYEAYYSTTCQCGDGALAQFFREHPMPRTRRAVQSVANPRSFNRSVSTVLRKKVG